MVNRSKNLGTAAETGVVRWLRENGWPSAERRALTGTNDCGDVAGTPGICWEVKAGKAAVAASNSASDAQILAWLDEADRECANARADFGVLVTKRGGVPASRAGDWHAYVDMITLHQILGPADLTITDIGPVRMPLRSLVSLLHTAGYGTAPAEVAR